MNIKCPHCGMTYDVEQKDLGVFVTCESCGKGFVAGTKAGVRQNGHSDVVPTITHQSTVNIATWICVVVLVLNLAALVVLCFRINTDFREICTDITKVRKSIDEMNEDVGTSTAALEKKTGEINAALEKKTSEITEELELMEKSRHNDAAQIYRRMGEMKLY